MLYAELQALARAHLGREGRAHTLQATEIVHIAYERLVKITNLDVSDRTKFLALAAQMIRHILVDHARKKAALKRQRGGERITLSGIEAPNANGESGEVDVLALHEALEELARLDERQAKVIEMLYFAGMNQHEAADLLGVSLRTVQTDAKMARAWLKRQLG
ncbi:MAG: sigma-70 family RNA polymerase sigma factor [Phycisphaerales bacterium]|nr:sigma-70 family RNA polymerase sigma factor [Phycisphaerales bacterium]